MTRILARRAARAAALSLLLAACSPDRYTGPTSLEDTEFAPALNVNLAASTRTAEGVYYRDLAVGTGPALVAGPTIVTSFQEWVADGTLLESIPEASPVELAFVPSSGLIPGLGIGMTGMQAGGRRQIIVPWAFGFGAAGFQNVPRFAILVFDVRLHEIR